MIEDESTSIHDAFGAAMHRLGDAPPNDLPDDIATAHAEVQAWLVDKGWRIDAYAPAPHRLAELIATLRRFDFPVTPSYFDTAANVFEQAASTEVEYARTMPDRTAAVETMLIGTVVIEQAIVDIRRLAFEATSFRIDATSRTGE